MLFYCSHPSVSLFMWIVLVFRPVSKWHQNSHLGLLYLNIRVGKIGFLKFHFETAFSKQGCFRHFSNPIFVPASSANQTLFLYLKNTAIKFSVQARIDAKLKMKVSLIAFKVLKCQLLQFESPKSDFPRPR